MKDEMNLKEIGEKIRIARNKLGLTQKEMAFNLGINKTTLSLVENGSQRTGNKLFSKISKELELEFSLSFPLKKNNINE